MTDVTRILSAIEKGDPSAAEQLLPLVYDELRQLAAQRMAQEKHNREGVPACLSLITGPSKTGDIELRLVTGVHGPGEVHVVLIDPAS